MCNCSGCGTRGPQGPSETSKVYFQEDTNARNFPTPHTTPAILDTGVMTFTITEAGVYRITASAHYSSVTIGTQNRVGIQKNGVVLGVYINETTPAASYAGYVGLLKEETLAVGDVISFVFGCTTGGSVTRSVSCSLLIEKLNN